MDSSRGPQPSFAFGPYEADLPSGELRKGGIRIKIQDLPLRLLSVLVEKPGQVVTREELQKRLWPEDTFVDFEDGLNTGVKKLREALGDDPEKPRYIETVPRRGYRFIAEVKQIPAPALVPVSSAAPAPPVAVQEPTGAIRGPLRRSKSVGAWDGSDATPIERAGVLAIVRKTCVFLQSARFHPRHRFRKSNGRSAL